MGYGTFKRKVCIALRLELRETVGETNCTVRGGQCDCISAHSFYDILEEIRWLFFYFLVNLCGFVFVT